MTWANEAVSDPRALVFDPDPKSASGAIRIIGYSPSAGFLITIVALREGDQLFGASAWKTTGGERRAYWKTVRG